MERFNESPLSAYALEGGTLVVAGEQTTAVIGPDGETAVHPTPGAADSLGAGIDYATGIVNTALNLAGPPPSLGNNSLNGGEA